MKIPDQINGYFPVALKVSEDPVVYHFIYIRKHQPRTTSEEGENAIYAVNLPTDTSLSHIRQLCQALGNTLVSDYIPELGVSGNRAKIIFPDKTACSRFLSKAKAAKPEDNIIWPVSPLSGSKRYLESVMAKYVDQQQLYKEVNSYMEEFAKEEERKLQQVQKLSQNVDEDGFTMVVGSKRKSSGGIAKPQIMTKEMLEAQQAKKKRKKEKTDFYRFQLREQKKNEMNNLLKRFQDDKLKIQELRQKKRFRPY